MPARPQILPINIGTQRFTGNSSASLPINSDCKACIGSTITISNLLELSCRCLTARRKSFKLSRIQTLDVVE